MIKMELKMNLFLPLRLTVHTNLWWNNFLNSCSVGGSMDASAFGINGGWGGIRTTAAFVDKFSENTTDTRANFIRMAKLKKSKT
jgi:hypothetical protein